MSLDAVDLFPNEFIDFLMIDGDHSYESVKADIAAWLPKMKKGGWIGMDDFNWSGVQRAATEAFGDRLIVVDTGKKQKKAHTKNAQYCYVKL
jgi:predicted O-methyltransferase YrrM